MPYETGDGVAGLTLDGAHGGVAESERAIMLTLAALNAARPREALEGEALVVRADVRTDRMGRPYIAMTLRDREGGVFEARRWQSRRPAEECPLAGAVYSLTGTADVFNGAPQLAVGEMRPVPGADLAAYARATRRPLADLQAELERVIGELEPEFGELVGAVLSDEVYERFITWPAAQWRHGAVRHGLLAHSLGVAAMARQLAGAYGPDGLDHDANLVAAACLLHDVGKVYTLPAIAGTTLPERAEQIDHVTLAVLMVRTAADRARPRLEPHRLDALLHAILAHHGRREWGAG